MSEPADNTQPIPSAEGQDKGPSKNALKKAAKEAEKAKKAAERAAKEAEQAAARSAAEVDYSEQNYGKLPLNQSQERTGRPRTQISALNASNDGEEVIIRARVHTSRAQGSKMVFFALRQRQHTVQALAVVAPETVSKQMVKWAAAVPLESIVLVEGTVKKSPEEIKGATIKDAEVHIKKFHLISEPEVRLPFNLEDVDKALEDERDIPTVSFDTRLNNRVLDLRTQTSQSIFILQSAVTDLFRESLQSKGFIEIHSPKLQGAATESGASVFKVDYFKGSAFLAQSPQLAKQMAIGADFERVYEIGPVFRAENSFTHRHLTEFTGLDLEMTIEEHYHEVMDTLDSMLLHIFNGLKTNADIEAIRRVYPSTEFTWLEKTLRLQWKDAIALLRENGVEIGDFDDINTETEKLLGRLVKDKYNTDYYILDKFPLVLRPFYTMPDPVDNRYSNSYDFFMRGEEILSGAQRVHDAKMLEQRMREVDINPADMQGYLDGFRMGIAPHGGGGIGLERVVMLFLKLGNIRNASLFPRDPKRLEPKNKNAIDHQSSHTLSAFLAIPIDVFKEIASLLTPEDILSLSRTNKFLRVLLMQRSSAPIWRTAGRNVEMLPSCPRHLSEPQYAALVFSKECSICGVIVMRQMDEHLSVRLCNTCRSENVIGVSQVPPVLVPYIPLSPYIKNTSRTNSTYALRADVERIESQLFKLPEDHEHHSYKRWDAKRRKRIRERTRHAMALLRYNNWTEVRKDDAMENVKYERIRDVQSRLLALGWKGEHMIMIESDAEKAWSRLICVSKPLTDRVWQRLCPKLLRLLKANRHHTHMMRKTRRQAERYECLEELLLDMRKGSCARLELAEADWPSASQQPEMFMPHPVLKEVLDYHVFKELLETDRSIEATRVKFHSSKELVNKAVLRWRAKLEDQLIDMLGNARAAQKREIPTTDELIEEALPFSTQLSEPSYDYVTPRNNGLFRADSVFTLGPQCGAMFYPNGFTTLVDIFCTLNQQLAETASTTFNASNLISSAVSHHTEGAAIAVALLKELGRPDAAYIEMEALGRMFLCGRCPYRQPQTWSSLIDHYVRERAKFLAYSSCNCHQRPDIAFNDIHDWRSASSWPLVRLLRDEEELNALNVRIPTVLEDLVECELCRELNLEVTFGSRRYIALHLRYVHSILQPEFGKHFTGMTTWFGGGLIEGGSGTVAGDGSAASSSGSQE